MGRENDWNNSSVESIELSSTDHATGPGFQAIVKIYDHICTEYQNQNIQSDAKTLINLPILKTEFEKQAADRETGEDDETIQQPRRMTNAGMPNARHARLAR